MKKIYRREYPWYYVLIVFVILCELAFLLYSVISADKSDTINFISQNVAVNVVLLIISFLFLKGLVKKYLLFNYNKELIEDIRRDINIKWEDIIDYKIEKKNSIEGLSVTIEYLNNNHNYVLVMNTIKQKNITILLGDINQITMFKIKRIMKKYTKNK